MYIKLKPYDAFIFGDGKEFGIEQTFRESNFFINPIPILGALNLDKKHNIEFISLGKADKLYFKIPQDIKKEKNASKFYQGKLKNYSAISEKGISHVIDFDTTEKIKEASCYIDEDLFRQYLLGDKNFTKSLETGFDCINIEDEIRPGIAIDHDNQSVKEGALFYQIFKRFEDDVYFYIKANIENISEHLRIGGEQKLFMVKKVDDRLSKFNDVKDKIKEIIKKSKFFKIILLTPSNGAPNIEGADLVANLIGKTITYSGWFKDKPTRIFRLIPEGSVFYYELKDESKLDKIIDDFWFKPAFYIKEYPYFDKKYPSGFGISAISFVEM